MSEKEYNMIIDQIENRQEQIDNTIEDKEYSYWIGFYKGLECAKCIINIVERDLQNER